MPLVDVSLSDEDIHAYLERLRRGWLTMGPCTAEFEEGLRVYLGVDHAIAVSSGTAALHIALLAAGARAGDEIIVPAMTFVASANAACYSGATPVFADALTTDDPALGPEEVLRLLTPRTRAVVAVHFMGYAADLREIRNICDERGIALIEDCCESFGASPRSSSAKCGATGDFAAYSFNSKAQLTVGEGGLIVCADSASASRCRSLRSHGMTSVTWDRHIGHHAGYDIVEMGFNYRLDEPRAALGMSQLARIEHLVEGRRASARGYRLRLDDLADVSLPYDLDAEDSSSPYGFVVLLGDGRSRNRVRSRMAERGVETTIYPLITRLALYSSTVSAGDLPRAESFADRHCILPFRPWMSDEDLDKVVDALSYALEDEGQAR